MHLYKSRYTKLHFEQAGLSCSISKGKVYNQRGLDEKEDPMQKLIISTSVTQYPLS